ncbi:MAG: AAA family ATPase, partial [Planctomycetota bacterium]
MRLKRLELFGFKSFADRTVLEFDEDLVGIVGPNGCGKSNVVDAVRWGPGATRPPSMRGGEMTDVIFKGSTSRPGMSLAEVTIVFDNEDGTVPAHGAEVSVTRRVHKDGEGEYLIDGGKVRLKDVKDLLFDTGLGSRGYAVLEQGRIDAVLSANPLERRAIFEEAAGISRFRQRRREAENRLKRVDQDTERLDDMLRELQSRSRSLKIQAGKAERWVAARDEWRLKGVRLAQHLVVRLEGDDQRLGDELTALESTAEELRTKREAADAEVTERAARNEALAEQVDQAAAEAARLAGDLRALDEREASLRARAQSAEQAADSEAARAGELEQRRGERRAELEELGSQLAQAADQRARAEGEVDELAGAARESGRRYRESR